MNELAFPELYSFSQLTAPAQDGSGPREDSGGDHEFLDEVPEPDTDVQQARKRARALESGQCPGWWRFFRGRPWRASGRRWHFSVGSLGEKQLSREGLG